jgi:hypothetical protein
MVQRSSVYVFRSAGFAPAANTVMSVASLDLVVSVYGGGGLKGEAGLFEAFGRAAFLRNDETAESYLGVWGTRNASRFRRTLREAGVNFETIREPPQARLVRYSKRARSARRSGTKLNESGP